MIAAILVTLYYRFVKSLSLSECLQSYCLNNFDTNHGFWRKNMGYP